MAYRYVLGDSTTEASRLRAQARLWDPVTLALLDRLPLRGGSRVLEIGPGQGSIHLELRRRVRGPVDAVEMSAAFVRRLQRACARDTLGAGRIWNLPLLEAPLPRAHYDVIFARWVFLFLPDPLAHLRKLVAALRPGGVLALQDYCRETLQMIPRPPEWPAFLAADARLFASQGGDASIGSRLPALYAPAGLEVVDVTPTVMTAHPGSAAWQWLTSYFVGVMHRLPGLDPAAARRLLRHWHKAGLDRTSLLIAPAVVDVVGRKVRARRSLRAGGSRAARSSG